MKRLLYTSTFLLFQILTFSQHQINLKEFDDKLLEELLLKGINEVRDTLNVDELSNEEPLKQAAGLQADHIQNIKKLSHYHEKQKYYKVENRVYHFRGDYSVILENLAQFDILKDVKIAKENRITHIESYEDLAFEIIRSWINSPGHFKNLKDKRVNSSGISIRFDSSKNRVYTVHVLGKSPIDISAIPVPKDIYGIHPILNSSDSKHCTECSNYFRSLPPEVGFGIVRDSSTNMLLFVFTDPNYFEGMFPHHNDGLAIDIINRNQFACGSSTKLNDNPIYKGSLLPPLYQKDIYKSKIIDEHNNLWIPLGYVPESIRSEELEFNIIFLRNNAVCRYQEFFDLAAHKWDLLEMGLFRDSINNESNSELEEITLTKTLRFEIPFEKNKSQYNQDDLKPLYDSLKLNSYNITKINISAFASVEGRTERNHELQEKRALSIVKALQQYQSLEIETSITTSENWVEFLNDIVSTPWAYMKKLSKDKIKNELKKDALSVKIEPLLAKERKAIISLQLEKKNIQSLTNPDEALQLLNHAIASKEYEKAHEIQLMIFSNLRNEKLPSDLLNKIEIPKSVETGLLLNHDIAFRFEFEYYDVIETYKLYKDLELMFPNNNHIKYNLCVLQLKAWLTTPNFIDQQELLKDISTLQTLGIPQELCNRLLINYHILLSEFYMYERNYTAKDKSLRLIKGNYQRLDLSEQDILNVAKYFVSYSKEDWAISLLQPYVSRIDASEDLLFYYVNLTIVNDQITKRSDYRSIMLNAYQRNPSRFCKLFNTYGKGGITFQLLRNPYLKKNYCENCN